MASSLLRSHLALLGGVLLISSCAVSPAPLEGEPGVESPFVLVLGTAQDGGLPQVACRGDRCERARREPSFRRMVASLLIVDPRTQSRWLIDATPDFPEQVVLADQHAPRPPEKGRPPLFEGVFLTHAHFGHYTGLAYLGREVYGARENDVWGSARMGSYLSSNGPWSQLVETGNIRLHTLTPGRPVALGEDLSITPFSVPHRDEFTDTLGFVVHGPERSVVYIPDIDKWSVFESEAGTGIEALILANDIALLDGSFFADGEIPGRAMAEIPHPFIEESLERFGVLPVAEREKVWFTHLNHTNPAVDPDGEAAARVRREGMDVAADGQRFEL